MEQAGFWYKGYDRRQLLCIRWGPHPPMEMETLPEVEFLRRKFLAGLLWLFVYILKLILKSLLCL